MIERILARMFPPALGYVDRASVTRHRIEVGEFQVVDPGPRESWAGNVREHPNGLWEKGTPVLKIDSAQPKKMFDLIESF